MNKTKPSRELLVEAHELWREWYEHDQLARNAKAKMRVFIRDHDVPDVMVGPEENIQRWVLEHMSP